VRVVRRKLSGLITTLLAVSLGAFFLTSLLPGDPAVALLGQNGVTAQAVAAVRRELGLDHSLPDRYLIWLDHVLHGNLGFSLVQQQSVSSLLRSHLPVTIELVVLSLILSLLVAIPIGIFTAYRAGRPVDQVLSTLTFVGLAVPSFVVAVILILLFAVDFRLVPASGWTPLTANPVENLRTAILPAVALALPQVAIFARVLRSDMVTTLQQDYIWMARSKGLSTWRVLLVHAFRPSSLPLLTVTGLQVGFLLGGTVIVENIFSLPGIGQLLVTSISSRDLIVVQGVTLFIAASFVLVNFAVDMLYSSLDPRIRRDRSIAYS
jgi:peptide/nickel transport system permease protein